MNEGYQSRKNMTFLIKTFKCFFGKQLLYEMRECVKNYSYNLNAATEIFLVHNCLQESKSKS